VTGRSTGAYADALILAGARLADGRTADVVVRDGVVAGVDSPAAGVDATGAVHAAANVLDLSGYLLLPAPAEPHAHLDKAYTAEAVPNATGDLAGAVTAWLRYRPTMAAADIAARATAALRTTLASGATAVRSHVDVGTDIGLRGLQALAEVRRAVRDECDLQLVAFVGVPLSGRAGADHRALLREALAAGADVAGGAPYLDPDPPAAIDACLSAAGEYGRPVDLHVDETLDPAVLTLATLADAVLATGFDRPVTASHCVSLAAVPERTARRVAQRVAAAGIRVVCLPQTNLYLQGRDHPGAPPRGLTALGTLRAAGVTVAAGGDNVQDPFNCVGRGDPLETAALLVLAGHEAPADAYAAVSERAREVLGLPAAGVAPGAAAELLAIRAENVRAAVATADPDRVVLHGGRVVARTEVRREYPARPSRPVAVGGAPRYAGAPERRPA
jgi:cytosine/creatinine deaminase